MTSRLTHFLELLCFATQHGTSTVSECTQVWLLKNTSYPDSNGYPLCLFNTLYRCKKVEKNAPTFFLQYINQESNENMQFPTSPVLTAFYWHITGRNPIIPKNISVLEDTVSHWVVLKTACLQRKMSFAHTVNCTLLNVRFKGQTTTVRLYKDCRIKLLFLTRVMLSA